MSDKKQDFYSLPDVIQDRLFIAEQQQIKYAHTLKRMSENLIDEEGNHSANLSHESSLNETLFDLEDMYKIIGFEMVAFFRGRRVMTDYKASLQADHLREQLNSSDE